MTIKELTIAKKKRGGHPALEISVHYNDGETESAEITGALTPQRVAAAFTVLAHSILYKANPKKPIWTHRAILVSIRNLLKNAHAELGAK